MSRAIVHELFARKGKGPQHDQPIGKAKKRDQRKHKSYITKQSS